MITPEMVRSAAARATASLMEKSIEERFADGELAMPYYPEIARREAVALAKRASLNLVGLHVNSLTNDIAPTAFLDGNGEIQPEIAEAREELGIAEKSRLARRFAFIDGESYIVMTPQRDGSWNPRVYQGCAVSTTWSDPLNDDLPATWVGAIEWDGLHPTMMLGWDRADGMSIWGLGDREKGTWAQVGFSPVAGLFFGGDPMVRFVSGEWHKDEHGVWTPTGEIKHLIGPQRRITQSVFDMLLVQQFGAIVIRTIAGMELPDDEDEIKDNKIEMAADRFIVAEDENVKFGSIQGTALDPFLNGVDSAIRHFSVVAMMSPTRVMGKLENVSAEAITSARQAEEDHRQAYRDRWTQAERRLTRLAMIGTRRGDPGRTHVMWRETEVRSLAQIADAAVKFFQAEIPVAPLIQRSLNWTDVEVAALGDEMRRAQQSRSDGIDTILSESRARGREALRALSNGDRNSA